MRTFLSDLGLSMRRLKGSPAFIVISILILAMGIGGSTAMFSVVDAVLLNKFPYRAPDRLVFIWERNPALGSLVGERVPTSYSNFREWSKQVTDFEEIAGFEDANLNRTDGSQPERIAGARASANFFRVLGVHANIGNTFDFIESDPGKSHVVLLSNAYFKEHFGGNRAVIGNPVTLNNASYSIVGVLPENFFLPATRGGAEQRKPDMWVPYDLTDLQDQDRRKMQVIGRLKDGVSLQSARAEMSVIGSRLEQQNPGLNAGFGANVFPLYVEDVGQNMRRNLLVLLGAVGFVLLVACANIANLMQARAVSQYKQMAIRKALGAGRWRLISQVLSESLLLSFAGALAGTMFAYGAIKVMVAMKPAGIVRPEQISPNLGVLLFTTSIALLTGIVVGIVPAFQIARVDANSVLKDTSGGRTFGARPTFRKVLVVLEVALALVLLAGGDLMVRSLIAVNRVDPGFRPEDMLTMHVSLDPSKYSNNSQIAALCRDVTQRISSLPGIAAVSFSDGLPMTRIRLMKFLVQDRSLPKRGSEPTADMRGISSPAYFDVLGEPILRGRNFTTDEIEKRLPVIIVNQALAKKLWPEEDAVGQHIRSAAKLDAPPEWLTVIGVSGDTKQASLESETRPEIIRPMVDYTYLTLSVRASLDPGSMTSAVQKQVWSYDKDIPIYDVRSMGEIVDENISERRFESFLLLAFAGFALLLAVVGIYGVMSSLTKQRTQEIGIRMALGAQRKNIVRMILGEGFRLVLVGTAIGATGAFILGRILRELLFGVAPGDPVVYLSMSFLIVAAACVASLLPARRAAGMDPLAALRYE